MSSAVKFRAAQKKLRSYGNSQRALISRSFFKTGPGQYGEGDKFIGATVAEIRDVARLFAQLSLQDLRQLLRSPIHEDRLLALIILVNRFKKSAPPERTALHKFYVAHLDRVNNWDLVDTSAPHLMGAYLKDKPREILDKLIKSKNVWKRRVAIVATLAFINNNDFRYVHKLAVNLLEDKHDLLHKASGWMLREMGKKNENELIRFLKKYAAVMPRTMLRYSIERLSPKQKIYYLGLKKK